MLDRVADDGRVAPQLELVENPAPVGTHRLWADAELGSDLFERDSGAEHAQHLVLPVGESIMPGALPASTEVGDQAARERRAHVGRAARDLADRLEQLPARMILTQVSCGARPQDAQGIGILLLHVQHEDTAPRVVACHVADEPEDRRGPEEQVEQEHVRFRGAGLLEHLISRRRLSHDPHVGALRDETLEPLADDQPIVRDEQLDDGGRRVTRRWRRDRECPRISGKATAPLSRSRAQRGQEYSGPLRLTTSAGPSSGHVRPRLW